MKKLTIYIVWALLCLNIGTNAQEITPLKVGQKVPLAILQQKMPYINGNGGQTDSIALSTYKGKLIILDFWATWCSGCIYQFEKLEKLQQQYPNQIKVLLVNQANTKDTPQRMQGIFSGKNAPFIKSNLSSIYNDTILGKLFPHPHLPHYAWIGPDGELLALTNADLVSELAIKGLFAAQERELAERLKDQTKNRP
jgi:thiol-disulfide isomerase/thioredoxin